MTDDPIDVQIILNEIKGRDEANDAYRKYVSDLIKERGFDGAKDKLLGALKGVYRRLKHTDPDETEYDKTFAAFKQLYKISKTERQLQRTFSECVNLFLHLKHKYNWEKIKKE